MARYFIYLHIWFPWLQPVAMAPAAVLGTPKADVSKKTSSVTGRMTVGILWTNRTAVRTDLQGYMHMQYRALQGI